ncbi:PREDICTED: protein app1-like [Vollenhovia emeryi]|uniref:protein app1-like n=1 Tax=Vollenhovia emeryi TaxID=411798 RepID=UPI0005F51549|nr:PREDICTED: protein app1-like [Vollenhovia emeryi]
MTDPTSRTPTLPRKVVPPARPPLVGITPSLLPGSRPQLSDGGQLWRRVVTRRIRDTTEMIRRGLVGPRQPPENIPMVDLSDEENTPPNRVAPPSAPVGGPAVSSTTGPTIRHDLLLPPHTIRLVKAPKTKRVAAVSAAGAAAPVVPLALAIQRLTAETTAPTAPSLAPATERPIIRDLPHTATAPAAAGPKRAEIVTGAGSSAPGIPPRMPRDPFYVVRATPREEHDVLVDGCLIRVPIGVKRWRTRIGKTKYALRLDPATGAVRHWSKRQL